jgi:hypothetical protein
MIREAVTGHRRHDHIKRIHRVAAVTAGVGQQGDDFVHLEECTRPAVRDHQRDRMGPLATLVDKMNTLTIHSGFEMAKGVD